MSACPSIAKHYIPPVRQSEQAPDVQSSPVWRIVGDTAANNTYHLEWDQCVLFDEFEIRIHQLDRELNSSRLKLGARWPRRTRRLGMFVGSLQCRQLGRFYGSAAADVVCFSSWRISARFSRRLHARRRSQTEGLVENLYFSRSTRSVKKKHQLNLAVVHPSSLQEFREYVEEKKHVENNRLFFFSAFRAVLLTRINERFKFLINIVSTPATVEFYVVTLRSDVQHFII